MVGNSIKGKPHLAVQLEHLMENEVVIQVLDAMNIFAIIVNHEREVIYGNQFFLNAIGLTKEAIIGMRPGDLLKCKNSTDSSKGCGYGHNCQDCKFKNLIVKVINEGVPKEELISLVSVLSQMEVSSNFYEKVTPISLSNNPYYLIALVDRGAEVERNNLQRVFFHDILNTAGSLYNIIQLIKLDNMVVNPVDLEMITLYIQNIIDEIRYHQNVSKAESSELLVTYEGFDIVKMIQDIIYVFKKDEQFQNIPIVFEPNPTSEIIYSDKVLLRRILTNLIKNALEANENLQSVTVTISYEHGRAMISVHNKEVVPEEVKRDIFIKGNSSKGNGRGFGVYGSKLMLNKYLKGDLLFESTPKKGTTFSIVFTNNIHGKKI